MLDTQTDAPPCPLWHMSEHFWSNCVKGIFHSSVQIFVVVVATRSHSSLDNTPQWIVWCGTVRTAWWSWQWCQRCWWATANPAAWKTFVQNIAHRKSKGCGFPIMLQPHVIQEFSFSQLRYEPRLRHCRVRCCIHWSIEKVRSNHIIWRHTCPYHHMRWIMFQLLCEIGILLSPEHHISVARTAIVGTFVTEKNLWAGYSIWECVQNSMAWFIVLIHVAIRQFIHESWAIRPHIQVFLHVVSLCWPGTPTSDDYFRVDFIGERSMEVATAARFQVRCFSPTPRPVFYTSKSERSFFPIQQCHSSWWSLIKLFPERSHHLGHGLSRVLSLMHPPPSAPRLSNCCVSHMENKTKFCGCGKSRVHYLAHCCQTTILHCTVCCAVLCKLILSLRCVLSGCTVTSHPLCIFQHLNYNYIW